MLNRVFTAGLAALAFCGIGVHGATTLYPMRDVGTNATLPQVALAQVESTNQVQVQATMSASVPLKPTSIAPSGASGVAEITHHGLLVHVKRLPPGRYDVQIVRKSISNPEVVGTLTIVDPTLGPSRQANDNKKEASAKPESVRIDTDIQMRVTSEVYPQDTARILVVGSDGNALLMGEVTSP
jgi:hypothetical protein